MLRVMEQMDLTYGSAGSSERGSGRGVPRNGFRSRRYLDGQFGASGASARRHTWQKSNPWEFWIPGCRSESTTSFRDFFRITRERFDLIYEEAADSGLFGLHPSEPLYSRIHPEGPERPGRHQDHKKIPLCLIMGASFRHLAAGDTYPSLANEFHIAESTLNDFDKKFWGWFRQDYWEAYVTGLSGVGFLCHHAMPSPFQQTQRVGEECQSAPTCTPCCASLAMKFSRALLFFKEVDGIHEKSAFFHVALGVMKKIE